MTQNIFLISERTLKKRSLISDPTLSVYLKPAIECAQKIGLRAIIGDCLLNKLQMLVYTKDDNTGKYLIELPEFVHYKTLLQNEITDYLCYATMSEIVIPARDKFRNAGIVNGVDNNYQQPGFDEITYVKRYFDDKAQYFGTVLREKIEEHLGWYPEYNGCGSCGNKNGKQEKIYNCGIVL
jgi:hypothetical protein